mmetsp:Transcript_163612/g.524615  ORF Transcript_163612/g.524615 Transcript_163612/m.524615 type:complete len:227 (+) Transcript_163612:473-1153(+)
MLDGFVLLDHGLVPLVAPSDLGLPVGLRRFHLLLDLVHLIAQVAVFLDQHADAPLDLRELVRLLLELSPQYVDLGVRDVGVLGHAPLLVQLPHLLVELLSPLGDLSLELHLPDAPLGLQLLPSFFTLFQCKLALECLLGDLLFDLGVLLRHLLDLLVLQVKQLFVVILDLVALDAGTLVGSLPDVDGVEELLPIRELHGFDLLLELPDSALEGGHDGELFHRHLSD